MGGDLPNVGGSRTLDAPSDHRTMDGDRHVGSHPCGNSRGTSLGVLHLGRMALGMACGTRYRLRHAIRVALAFLRQRGSRYPFC
jgi:hypothetical protein